MRSLSIVRGAVIAAAALCLWAPAGAQQHTSAPQGDLAKEQQERQIVQPFNNAPVWKEVRSGTPQYSSLPGRANSILIQPEGQTWRAQRVPISATGGFVFALALLGIVAFYSWRGPIVTRERPTGHLIRRFTTGERIIHWTVAIAFVTLGITGLIITFGKAVLLPLIGFTLFSWLAILAKNLHNFVGPVLAVALPILIVTFVRENIPRAYDWIWLKRFGGIFDRSGDAHVPAGKANAGQKGLFWIMAVAAGLTLVVTGLILDFPNFGQTRQTMQLTNTIHLIAGMVGVTFLAAHIYLGTIGMRGAYDAMRYGYVDESWARQHHEYWYHEVMREKAAHGLETPTTGEVAVDHRAA